MRKETKPQTKKKLEIFQNVSRPIQQAGQDESAFDELYRPRAQLLQIKFYNVIEYKIK